MVKTLLAVVVLALAVVCGCGGSGPDLCRDAGADAPELDAPADVVVDAPADAPVDAPLDAPGDCLPSQCPAPPDLSCASAKCNADNTCGIYYYPTSEPCGPPGGHCDGTGTCLTPASCPIPCTPPNECTASSCDEAILECVSRNLNNETICDAGKGHCNSSTGTCCDNLQVAICPGVPDPGTCLAECAANVTACSIACVTVCPPLTVPDVQAGLCVPML